MRLYHFLGVDYAIDDLKKKRIKISYIEDLNDPYEFMGFYGADEKTHKCLLSFKKQMDTKYGIICCSDNWSEPLLWSHYAKKHSGVAFAFDVDDDICSPVKYVSERLVFDYAKRNVMEMMLIKYERWRYENEYRVFADVDNRDAGLSFCSLTNVQGIVLREVIIGIRCDAENRKKILELQNDWNNQVTIVEAIMHPTKYEIIPK